MKKIFFYIVVLSIVLVTCCHAKVKGADKTKPQDTKPRITSFRLKPIGPLCPGDTISKGAFAIVTVPSSYVDQVTVHTFDANGVDKGLQADFPGWHYVTAILKTPQGTSSRKARFYVIASDERYNEVPRPSATGRSQFPPKLFSRPISTGGDPGGPGGGMPSSTTFWEEYKNGTVTITGSFPDAPHEIGATKCGGELHHVEAYSIRVGGKIGLTAKDLGLDKTIGISGEFSMDYTTTSSEFTKLPASERKEKTAYIYDELRTIKITGTLFKSRVNVVTLFGEQPGQWRQVNSPYPTEISQKYGAHKQTVSIECCGGG